MNSFPKKERGVILVVVLWLLTLLTIMAMGFSSSMRTETRSMRNIIDNVKAGQLADAAIHQGIFKLLNRTPEEQQQSYGLATSFSYNGEQLRLQLWDEQGKININLATEEQLAALFLSLNLELSQSDSLIGAIIDWRDEDELRQLNGAEAAEYVRAGLRSRPSNKPFQSIAELQQVLGISSDIYSAIAPLITIYSSEGKINPALASKEALLALPNVDPIEVEALLQARALRADNPTEVAPLPMLTGVEPWLTNATGPFYTIRGTVQLSSGAKVTHEMLIWLPATAEMKNYYVLESRTVDNPIKANYIN